MASSQVRVGELAFLADREREGVRSRVGWESGGGGVEMASLGCGREAVGIKGSGCRSTVHLEHGQKRGGERGGDWAREEVLD